MSKNSKNDIKKATLLKKIMRDINTKYKKDVIKFAKDEKEKERIPFGIKEIDELVGGGGVCGNIAIVYGNMSVGKTTLALHQIATAQKMGKTCLYIDLEHSFNKTRAEKLGIDLSKLLLIEDINNAEEAMDIIIKVAKEKVVDYISLDSINALSPKLEQVTKTNKEKSIEDDDVALLARKMSKFLRVVANPIYQSKIFLLLIGQVRIEGIGSFFIREGLSGGLAQRHWSIFTLYMRRGQKVDAPKEKYKEYFIDDKGKQRYKTKEKIVGFDCVITLQKIKIDGAKEGTEIHLPFYFDSGFFKPIKREQI